MNDSAKRYSQYLRNLQSAEAAHCLHESDVQADLAASLSPLRHGQIAAKASHRLENRLFRRLVAAALIGEPAPAVPEYDIRIAIPMAKIVGTECILWRPLDSWSGHGFIQGTTGSGKSTGQVVLIDCFLDKQVRAVVFARKEAGRLLLRYSTFAAWILRARRSRRSPAKPPLRLLEAVVTPTATNLPLVLQLPGGARVELRDASHLPLVVALVRALEKSC